MQERKGGLPCEREGAQEVCHARERRRGEGVLHKREWEGG